MTNKFATISIRAKSLGRSEPTTRLLVQEAIYLCRVKETGFANGFTPNRATVQYVLFRRSDSLTLKSQVFSRGPYQKGELRIDPAPRWNRSDNTILIPGMTQDGTRQLHLLRIQTP